MFRTTAFLLASLLMTSVAIAQTPAPAAAADSTSCESKAVGKNGKPLAGAAKASFLKKCNGASAPADNGCAAKAIGKNGKPLAGAAKNSFMKKCNAG
jgi:hypothetical protein